MSRSKSFVRKQQEAFGATTVDLLVSFNIHKTNDLLASVLLERPKDVEKLCDSAGKSAALSVLQRPAALLHKERSAEPQPSRKEAQQISAGGLQR